MDVHVPKWLAAYLCFSALLHTVKSALDVYD